MKQYKKPELKELGTFAALTEGPGGSFNDSANGGGGGQGNGQAGGPMNP